MAAAPGPHADVGHRIVEMREALGLSQAAFARRVGLSRNALVYERGERLPRSARLVQIARTGGVTADWLLGGQEPTAGNNDSEWTRAVMLLRGLWRDRSRRPLVIALLRGLQGGNAASRRA